MPAVTWWAFGFTLLLIAVGAAVFYWVVVKGNVKKFEHFQQWTAGTAIVAAILVLLSSIPVATTFPNSQWLKDISVVANTIGPLALTISVTLASIFYSAGEWYETAQRFRQLGIVNAKPDRQGRQYQRAQEWQDRLRGTKRKITISGTTLGGWFASGWEDTRESLLAVLPHAKVCVLLADPDGQGFLLRAEDPGEKAEALRREQARARAAQVYERIGQVIADGDFSHHIQSGRLSFRIYNMTPLSAVWVDDEIFFTPYLPYISDSNCPEYVINQRGTMGVNIATAIERLVEGSTPIQTVQHANELAVKCSVGGDQ